MHRTDSPHVKRRAGVIRHVLILCVLTGCSFAVPQEFPEFCALMLKRMEAREDEKTLNEAFRLLDLDGSGYIGRDELKAVMRNFSKATEEIDDSEIDALI